MTRLIKFFAVWLFLVSSLSAGNWVSGGVMLHEVNGEVLLGKLGEGALQVGGEQVPISSSGLIECEAAYGSSAFFSLSNGSSIFFEGDGSFAVERFEQLMPDAADWETEAIETTQSRVILNFRAGDIIVDNRNMQESSQCLIETPLGRLTVKRALWQMRIVFDPRSQIFDFTITCTEGRVRFTDLQGQQYTLRTGQRLAGAGSRMLPSIKVGERTDRSREQMQRYQDLATRHQAAANDLAQYLDFLLPIEQDTRQATVVPRTATSEPTRRPIVIEYAKEPDPVTPFRGKVKPPSAYQADLF